VSVVGFLVRRSRLLVVSAAIAGVVSGLANTGLLAVINSALAGSAGDRHRLVLVFGGLCLLVPVSRIASELMLIHLGQRTVFDLRVELSRRILAVPLRRLEELGASRLLANLTEDVPAITNLATQVPVLSINVAIVASGLAYLGYLSWQVLLLVVGFIALGALGYWLAVQRALRHFEGARRETDRLYQHFRTLTSAAKELKLHARRRERFFERDLVATADATRAQNVTGLRVYTFAASWGHLLVFLVIGLVIFGFPAWAGAGTEMLTGYALVLLFLMTPLQVLMNALPALSRAKIAVSRVEELGVRLAEAASEPVSRGVAPPAGWRSIELLGVSHVYPSPSGSEETFVLGPLDVRLEPGKTIFVVGGNGSGKTTLAKLIVGLYEPESGAILLDGEPVGPARREEYRQLFTAVFADFHLFEGLLGLEQPDLDERARRYLEELQLEHKVKIEDGRFSTLDLSHGQRKRLALLTAYLEDRPIYLFDEWAADQDPVFREVFYRTVLPALRERGKALVVISHDERYYDLADELLKLDYGRVIERTVCGARRDELPATPPEPIGRPGK
jgi:putative ATP-binding cassette transporter